MFKSTTVVLGATYLAASLSTVSAQAAIGSPAWQAAWPPGNQIQPVTFPPEWQADFSTIVFNGTANAPLVPSGQVGKANANYCDWSYNLCNGTNDVVQCNGPLEWGLTFDDGPIAPQSETLYDFLSNNSQKATHFMIGSNIVQAPALVQKAFSLGNQIAVHTWTHRPMTTLSSQVAYAELRYCRDIIKNITGFTPLWWRPPYGDVDDRIRAIATHLGLITTIWNQDTNDWCIGDTTAAADGCGAFSADSVHTNLELWAVNQKTAPNGVVVLEHELSPGAVQQFMEAYPTIKSNGWNIQAVGTCANKPFYLESVANTTTSSAAAPATPNTPTAAPAAASPSQVKVPSSSASLIKFGALSVLAVFVGSVILL